MDDLKNGWSSSSLAHQTTTSQNGCPSKHFSWNRLCNTFSAARKYVAQTIVATTFALVSVRFFFYALKKHPELGQGHGSILFLISHFYLIVFCCLTQRCQGLYWALPGTALNQVVCIVSIIFKALKRYRYSANAMKKLNAIYSVVRG